MRALGLLLLVAGSALAAGPFPHDVHVTNFEVKCDDCHAQGPTGLPAQPQDVCLGCHEPSVPEYVTWKRPPLEAPFPHRVHARALDCLSCHRQVLDDKRVRGVPVMPRKECAECHSRQGLKTAFRQCTACHQGDQRKQRPVNHGSGWLEGHGLAADARGFEQHGANDCELCHVDDGCVKCHRERRPRSHTGLWSIRLHGTAASFDSDGCKTCHETGVCVRCHQSTRPMNHVGAWNTLHGLAAGVTGNESCRACHSAAQCTSCHRVGL